MTCEKVAKRISNGLNSCIIIKIRELRAVGFLLLELQTLVNPWRLVTHVAVASKRRWSGLETQALLSNVVVDAQV
jgi:hypothetical protein